MASYGKLFVGFFEEKYWIKEVNVFLLVWKLLLDLEACDLMSPFSLPNLLFQDLFKPALDVDLSLVLPVVVQHLICGKGDMWCLYGSTMFQVSCNLYW